jgi:hypothetical protein
MWKADPALIARAAGNGRVHDYAISRLEARYLLPNLHHDCTALMTNAKREPYNLIADPSLRVIVEIGSADAHSDDPEQYVCRMPQRRGGLFHDFDFSNSRKHHGFHKGGLLLRRSRGSLFPVSFEKKYMCSRGQWIHKGWALRNV